MTEQEFNRYQKAVEIKQQIDNIQRELNYLNSNFDYETYPRSESGWCLFIRINDASKSITLSSEEFWECFKLVKTKKENQLVELQEKFNQL